MVFQMKTNKITTLILLLLLQVAVKAQTNNFYEKEIIVMLRTFYTGYINETDKLKYNQADTIVKKYCTALLQNQLYDEDIDYDVLLDGQFCETDWLKTMTIHKDNKADEIYIVTFSYNSDGRKIYKKIKLQIIKENLKYKINKVIIDN